MHFVPANNVDCFPSSFGLYLFELYGNEDLITGIDSPVSIDSFITHDPLSKITSQGMIYPSGISIISPGTKFNELTFFLPFTTSSSIFKWPLSYFTGIW